MKNVSYSSVKSTIPLILALAFAWGVTSSVAEAKRVACVGASITHGYGLPDRQSNCYPAQLAKILQVLDDAWETRNFGVSGACVLRKGSGISRPYITLSAFDAARAWEPDVVVIQLGGNDSRPHNWVHKDDFIPDFLALIDGFKQLPSEPETYIWYPNPVFSSPSRNSVIRDEIIPLIAQLPTYRDVQVIDMYTPLEEARHLFQADGAHLNIDGTRLAAEIVAAFITGVRNPDLNGDGVVDSADMHILVDYWGRDEPSCDLVPIPLGDGIIDIQDLIVLSEYMEDVDTRLIAHWRLDEETWGIAHDSATDNDGILQGDPIWLPNDGKLNGALKLDGIDDYLITPFILDPTKRPFSVYAWIKGGQPGQTIISQKGGFGAWLSVDSAGALATGLTFPMPAVTSNFVVTDDQWHRVGLVSDGSGMSLYVDDIEVARRDLSPILPANGDLQIGAGKNLEPGSFWEGLIDDVRTYDRAVKP